MNKKRIILAVISLILIICLLAGCSSVPSVPSPDSSEQSESESHSEGGDGNDYIDPSTIVIEWRDNDKRGHKELFGIDQPLIEENTDWEPEDSIQVYGKYQDSFPVVTNNTPLEKMVSEIEDPWFVCMSIYDLAYTLPIKTPSEDFILQRSLQTSYLSLKERCVHGDKYIYMIPVNFLRKMDVEGWYYTAAKFNDGYVYYIYGPLIEENDDGEYVYKSNDSTDIYLYGAVYAENIRSYKDFESIKKGSSISDVISIDSSAVFTLANNRYYRDNLEQPFYRMGHTFILLTDGLLEIVYEPRNPEEMDYDGQTVYKSTDDLVVRNIRYFKDFNFVVENPGFLYDFPYADGAVIPIHIYSYDYPEQ